MKKLLNKKIVSIECNKDNFIIHTEKEAIDLSKEYDLSDYKLHILPSILEQIETGFFNNLFVTALRTYEGKNAMGVRGGLIKQKRFTVSLSVQADLEMPDPDATLPVTFFK